ncbi:unnamed protein product [Protopolystoma xenopodis]|uniref:SRCR domain-containing protein n=1 Tax=Protopolystoma xenopodis TaxID=117903 RepID=A0A3S5BRS4_9PLAT|nr:unnamed protein product [Protopolystoma xenopodis]
MPKQLFLITPAILYKTLLNRYIMLIILSGLLAASMAVTPTEFKDGDIRLVDGLEENSGTVLIYRGYAWGLVCDDSWSLKEAGVVCRQLGLGQALQATRKNQYSRLGSTSASNSPESHQQPQGELNPDGDSSAYNFHIKLLHHTVKKGNLATENRRI